MRVIKSWEAVTWLEYFAERNESYMAYILELIEQNNTSELKIKGGPQSHKNYSSVSWDASQASKRH